jgi:hypothetical protein
MYGFCFTFRTISIGPVEWFEVDGGRGLEIERGGGFCRCGTSSTLVRLSSSHPHPYSGYQPTTGWACMQFTFQCD